MMFLEMFDKEWLRFVVLILVSVANLTAYFCSYIPSVLEDVLLKHESADEKIHLTLTAEEYNLLYTFFDWGPCFFGLPAGYIVDKYGKGLAMAIGSLLLTVGSITLACCMYITGGSFAVFGAIFSRFLMGAGFVGITGRKSPQRSPKSRGLEMVGDILGKNELSIAFGSIKFAAAVGIILNFYITPIIKTNVGPTSTLWVGVAASFISLCAALLLLYVDKKTESWYRKVERKAIQWKNLLEFNLSFWILTMSIAFYYSGFLPLVANGSKFIHDTLGYTFDASARILGATAISLAIASPAAGYVMDYFGFRGVMISISTLMSLMLTLLLAYSYTVIPPVVITLIIGVNHAIVDVTVWTSVALVVPDRLVGMSAGLATTFQSFGAGVADAIVGLILNTTSRSDKIPSDNWDDAMGFLIANFAVAAVFAFILNVVDWKEGWELNKIKDPNRSDGDEETNPILGS